VEDKKSIIGMVSGTDAPKGLDAPSSMTLGDLAAKNCIIISDMPPVIQYVLGWLFLAWIHQPDPSYVVSAIIEYPSEIASSRSSMYSSRYGRFQELAARIGGPSIFGAPKLKITLFMVLSWVSPDISISGSYP
jgi:hypothetical protein